MDRYFNLLSRILLALLFLMAGIGKMSNPAGTMHYMEAMGVPGVLLWPTIAFELLSGVAIVIGYQTRLAAYAMAAFCVVSALIFHRNFGDQMQMIMFLKNMGLAGGFLLLASSGATAFALDARRRA
jgi:putative oxidoreductase